MIGILRVTLLNLVFLTPLAYSACLPSGADMKAIPGYVSSYSATISDQDRQNSSGQPIEGMKAFLQQDRANVNRFNRGDPQDEKDNFFITPQNRQLFLSANYAGRCGRDYVELVKALEQKGQNTSVNVHIVKDASNLTLYVELVKPTVSAQAAATSGPSFDCSKASSPVEFAICDNTSLAQLDTQLSKVYRQAQKKSSDPNALRTDQRAWVKTRNQCGANVDCISNSYAQRINTLEAKPALESNPQSAVIPSSMKRPPATASATTETSSSQTPISPQPVTRPIKTFTQILLDQIGPNGWARCSSSQIALSALQARDGSLPKNFEETNNILGTVLIDVRKLMLSQGYPPQTLDRFFSLERVRTPEEAINNVANCMKEVKLAFDASKKAENPIATSNATSAAPVAPIEESSKYLNLECKGGQGNSWGFLVRNLTDKDAMVVFTKKNKHESEVMPNVTLKLTENRFNYGTKPLENIMSRGIVKYQVQGLFVDRVSGMLHVSYRNPNPTYNPDRPGGTQYYYANDRYSCSKISDKRFDQQLASIDTEKAQEAKRRKAIDDQKRQEVQQNRKF